MTDDKCIIIDDPRTEEFRQIQAWRELNDVMKQTHESHMEQHRLIDRNLSATAVMLWIIAGLNVATITVMAIRFLLLRQP